MTIRNKKAYVDSLWDWGFLDDCFGGTGIRVSDIDGVVERNGHVLFIEAKPLGKPVSAGQSRMFAQLAENGFSILVIWGDTDNPSECMLIHPKQLGGKRTKMAATKDTIFEIVRRWFVWANHFPRHQLDNDKWPLTINLPR